jgi:hypothetical protein
VPRIDDERIIEFFLITHFQPTDRRSVVGDHVRKIRKERGHKERKKER